MSSSGPQWVSFLKPACRFVFLNQVLACACLVGFLLFLVKVPLCFSWQTEWPTSGQRTTGSGRAPHAATSRCAELGGTWACACGARSVAVVRPWRSVGWDARSGEHGRRPCRTRGQAPLPAGLCTPRAGRPCCSEARDACGEQDAVKDKPKPSACERIRSSCWCFRGSFQCGPGMRSAKVTSKHGHATLGAFGAMHMDWCPLYSLLLLFLLATPLPSFPPHLLSFLTFFPLKTAVPAGLLCTLLISSLSPDPWAAGSARDTVLRRSAPHPTPRGPLANQDFRQHVRRLTPPGNIQAWRRALLSCRRCSRNAPQGPSRKLGNFNS